MGEPLEHASAVGAGIAVSTAECLQHRHIELQASLPTPPRPGTPRLPFRHVCASRPGITVRHLRPFRM
ncbi:hypothetical protein QJS10_CPA06g00527 [Acorus calamus]|uniref:Uncharacterized protein n=1 Tax=Acorus calamus TaxID=4465 RepID=A0AAV9EMN6_ACOCL|nr:hypothetical protein QJS10_CPA06g00527 [Acorus calamus]